MDQALSALRKVNFDWTAHIEEIWVDQPDETPELQAVIRAELHDRLDDLSASQSAASPLGVPLLGPAGSGKTHLLGVLRRQAIERKMYFILGDMTDVADFWETVSLGYLRSLQQPLADGRRQVDHWLDRMIVLFGKQTPKAKDIPKQRPPALINRAEELINQVRLQHRAGVQEHVDVLRALILFACDHTDINDLGYKWLQGLVIDDEELGVIGFRQKNQTPSRIVRGLSWLLSLTGPTVLALDQLDAIVAEHELARSDANNDTATDQQRRSLAIIQGIAGGLLELRDLTRCTLTVVSTLEATWDILHRQAAVSMSDRFDSKLLLRPGTGVNVYKDLVAGRLRKAYAQHGYIPPQSSYPFGKAFFERYRGSTPRELLKACEAHRKECRSRGIVFPAAEGVGGSQDITVFPKDWAERIAARFAQEKSKVDIAALLSDDKEKLQDQVLEAACDALALENRMPDSVATKVDKDFMGTGTYDPLHVRLRLILAEEQERERHHSFRFLEKSHPSAFQARLKAALTASGIDQHLSFRGLTIIRCSAKPTGEVSTKLLAELEARGGRLMSPSEMELRVMLAVKRLLGAADEPDHFEEWLERERPVSQLPCFAHVVATLFETVRKTTPSTPAPSNVALETIPTQSPVAHLPQTPIAPRGVLAPPAVPSRPATINAPQATVLTIGRRLSAGELQEPVEIPISRLPYHACVFAGSGSGKTVFLKRVIEEAALLGIPTIVVDPGNDLSRLGLPWPHVPSEFTVEDQAKAAQYHAKSEVVIWTPGASQGNPMRLSPLPDFQALKGEGTDMEAELRTAIDIATTSIASIIIKQQGSSAKKQTSILHQTLAYLAARGGTIHDLVALLREPPDEIIAPYEKGDKMAKDLSELLHAELDIDPLLGGSGTPLDPALLFRASDPSKTRISVLSLVGLPGYDEKRRFIDQLASTLFTWIKKNPAQPGGILGLLVLDEAKDFVPSGKNVPGKENVIRLAAQARKYGLGLLFANQEPRTIDHTIVSNCSTLLGGRQNSPATIDTLQQLLSDKGTHVKDIATLPRGTFYFTSDGIKPRKIVTSLCLSYHPSSPPSETEVLIAARQSASHLKQA